MLRDTALAASYREEADRLERAGSTAADRALAAAIGSG
jgi:hypothetical protein